MDYPRGHQGCTDTGRCQIKPALDHDCAFLIDFDQEMNHVRMLRCWYCIKIIKIIFWCATFHCGKIVEGLSNYCWDYFGDFFFGRIFIELWFIWNVENIFDDRHWSFHTLKVRCSSKSSRFLYRRLDHRTCWGCWVWCWLNWGWVWFQDFLFWLILNGLLSSWCLR